MMLFPLRDLFLLSYKIYGYKITSIIRINHWSLKIPFSIKICVMKLIHMLKQSFQWVFFLLIRGFGDVSTFREEI